MLEKSRNAVFFQWLVCRVSRKLGLLKRRVRRYVFSRDIKNCMPLWLKKSFWSEDVQNTSCLDHFSKLRCRKIAPGCGEKHIWKWRCTKHGPLFEVAMSKNYTPLWRKTHYEVKMLKNWGSGSTFWSSDVKKCTPLWRETHLEVKMLKHWRSRSTFWSCDVEKLHAAVAKSAFWSEKVQNTSAADSLLKFWCRKIARTCGEKHICQSRCTKYLSFGALFQVQMSNN